MNTRAAQQLVVTAAVSSVVSISALLAYQSLQKRRRRLQLNEEILEKIAEQAESNQQESALEKQYETNEAIVREQLARNYAFFGEEGMDKIRGSKVAVIGCGGVGSWASVMLVRS